MIVLLLATLASLAVPSVAPLDSATLCVNDAATGAPIVGALIAPVSGTDRSLAAVRARAACIRLPLGTWIVRRLGYRPRRVVLSDAGALSNISLAPLIGFVAQLDTVQTFARASDSDATRPFARVSSTLSARDARLRGAATSGQLIEQLPYTQATSARGETGLQLRGARREQTAITLDGLPLNDPSTGIADVADLPLSAIGTATVALGADPLGVGPGASGGVLALSSSADRLLALRGGSFGQRSAEGAWSDVIGGALIHLAAMERRADNDFAFVNEASSLESRVREQRVNNDEARRALMLGAVSTNWQFSALASHSERGMVGPENVRTYDADRATTDRLMLRTQAALHAVRVVAGVRSFDLAYRDPARPELNASANAYAADVEGSAQSTWGHVPTTWRVGAGSDEVRATGNVRQSRSRAFAALISHWERAGTHVEVGARADAIEHAGVLPSFSLAIERPLTSSWQLTARAAQSVRVPTLYDLYFSSPQRLFVRTLDPERVVIDADVAAKFDMATSVGRVNGSLALVTRDTRNAIVWFPGNFGWSPANVGREELRGAEARASLASRWYELSMWGTFYDAELTSGTLRIPTPYVPRTSAGLQSLVHWSQFNASARVRATGRRPFSAGPRNRAFELPSVSLLDLAVTHAWPRVLTPQALQATATWSLDNATNVAWQSVRGFPSPGRSWALAFTFRQTPHR